MEDKRNKISIEQANPFTGFDNVVNSINDIKTICTNIEFKSEAGLIVSLPDNETSLLADSTPEELLKFDTDSSIDVHYDPDGIVCKDNGQYNIYKNIISKTNSGNIYSAQIIDKLNHGLLVTINGLQCFLPEGQIGLEKGNYSQTYINTIDVKLISIKLKEKEGNRFLPIVSHKIIEDEKNAIEAQDKLRNIKIGSIIQGTVKNITSYGVFVTLFPTIEGLIHITDLSWKRVSNPSEILFIGQNINVIILDIKQMNDGKTQISLGLKQLTQRPWELLDKNSKKGDVVYGSICNITDYGIFIMLSSGVQGLVHRTELSWNPKITSKDFHKGQIVTAKIINIDWEKEKLLLSIKQMQTDPWEDIEGKIAVGDVIRTTISNFTNWGIFVTIVNGIEGLIHLSELSWTEKIKKPQDHYTLGEELKAIIISIDKDKKMIELSHKQIQPNPWQKYSVGQHVNAIILEIEKHCIQLKLEDDNLPAIIPARLVDGDYNFEENSKLECIIQEIDENKRRIILAIA